MNKIRIITDSASDIGQKNEYGVIVLPMAIGFGGAEYLDGIDITHREFYEKLIEMDEMPVTSLVSPTTFSDAFKEAVDDGDKVIAITISSDLSGTYQSAVLAASEYENEVFVVDSKNAAIGEQILVVKAVELVKKGISIHEIVEELNRIKGKIHLIAVLDTLEYLQKGGRISKSVAFVGGMLSIKPVVAVRDGKVVMVGKARGSKNVNNYLIKEIESTAGIDFSNPLRMGYSGLSDVYLKKYIKDSERLWRGHDESLVISSIGPTIGTHAGPGAIAVSFFEKE